MSPLFIKVPRRYRPHLCQSLNEGSLSRPYCVYSEPLPCITQFFAIEDQSIGYTKKQGQHIYAENRYWMPIEKEARLQEHQQKVAARKKAKIARQSKKLLKYHIKSLKNSKKKAPKPPKEPGRVNIDISPIIKEVPVTTFQQYSRRVKQPEQYRTYFIVANSYYKPVRLLLQKIRSKYFMYAVLSQTPRIPTPLEFRQPRKRAPPPLLPPNINS